MVHANVYVGDDPHTGNHSTRYVDRYDMTGAIKPFSAFTACEIANRVRIANPVWFEDKKIVTVIYTEGADILAVFTFHVLVSTEVVV